MCRKTMSSWVPAPPTDEVTILETREAAPTHFLMKFELFSFFNQNKIKKYETGEFIAGGYKWRLIFYSNEDIYGIDSKYISVHLAISDTTFLQNANSEVNAVFSIFLLNQTSGNYHYSLGRTQRFDTMKLEWDIPKFISKEILMDPSNGFLINDTCVFGAEVFIVQMLAVSECLYVKNVTMPYKREWKISNFSELGNIWTSEKFVVEGLNWKVLLYPKGWKEVKAIGLYIRLLSSKKVMASFSKCIKDQINNKHRKYTGGRSCTAYDPSPKNREMDGHLFPLNRWDQNRKKKKKNPTWLKVPIGIHPQLTVGEICHSWSFLHLKNLVMGSLSKTVVIWK